MTTIVQEWGALGTPTIYLTTELNALASAGRIVGAAIDGNQMTNCMVEVNVAAQTARTAGAYLAVYLIKSIDGGSTYEYGAAALQPGAHTLVCCLPLDAATTARVVVGTFTIPADCYFELCLENNSTQAFAATGTTMKYALYKGQLT